ncbi:CUBN [Branchiostoma lanceolatum]|uniref:CUBN protein n=1 Tax=Branchiostoma lanceolatum TaxID=7740 RepID=A0A8J9ZLD1_BRALA|nr:CUBN [Branchiostoma lanceolatum]
MVFRTLLAVFATVAAAQGQSCVFPFTYHGGTFNSCTSVDSDVAWCSTDAVYVGNYVDCDERYCTFPFTYHGMTFTTCTMYDDDRPWCSISPQYGSDHVYCSDGAAVLSVDAEVDKPAGCHFPFEYNGVTHTTCTMADSSDPWCSLDQVFDGDWAWCTEGDCVFPFEYANKTYDSCTTDDNDGFAWCSMTPLFEDNWVYCDSGGCGGALTDRQGRVESPNYPVGYPDNQDCKWLLQPRGGHATISFGDFNLEASGSLFTTCPFDYVQVTALDGTDTGQRCGTDTPANVSSHTDITVHFVTDASINSRGFYFDYSVLGGAPGTQACGGEVTGNSGEVASSGFPAHYDNNVDCTWTLPPRDGTTGVTVTFTEFMLEHVEEHELGQYTGCIYDFVEIFDGPNRLGRWCGDKGPDPVTSANGLKVRFKTDAHTVDSGFKFSYQYSI